MKYFCTKDIHVYGCHIIYKYFANNAAVIKSVKKNTEESCLVSAVVSVGHSCLWGILKPGQWKT